MFNVQIIEPDLLEFLEILAAEDRPNMRNGLLQKLYFRATEGSFSPEYLLQVAKILIDNSDTNLSMMLKAVRLERMAEENTAQIAETVEGITDETQGEVEANSQ